MSKKTIALLFIIGIVVAIIGGVALGGIVLFIGGILSTISWIGALVAVGKQGRWGWFVCILLLSGLGELIYLIAGPGLNTASAPIQQM
ncbi:MAG: hypothetical protein ABI234_01270 [Ktedonobacteraceae bacterium]